MERSEKVNDIPSFHISPAAQKQKGGRRGRGKFINTNHPTSPVSPLKNLNSPMRVFLSEKKEEEEENKFKFNNEDNDGDDGNGEGGNGEYGNGESGNGDDGNGEGGEGDDGKYGNGEGDDGKYGNGEGDEGNEDGDANDNNNEPRVFSFKSPSMPLKDLYSEDRIIPEGDTYSNKFELILDESSEDDKIKNENVSTSTSVLIRNVDDEEEEEELIPIITNSKNPLNKSNEKNSGKLLYITSVESEAYNANNAYNANGTHNANNNEIHNSSKIASVSKSNNGNNTSIVGGISKFSNGSNGKNTSIVAGTSKVFNTNRENASNSSNNSSNMSKVAVAGLGASVISRDVQNSQNSQNSQNNQNSQNSHDAHYVHGNYDNNNNNGRKTQNAYDAHDAQNARNAQNAHDAHDSDDEDYKTPVKKPIIKEKKEEKKPTGTNKKKPSPSINSLNKGKKHLNNKKMFFLSDRKIPNFSNLTETEVSQMWTNLEHDFNKIRKLNPDNEITMPDPETETLQQAVARKNQFLYEMRKDDFIEGKVDEYQMGMLIMWIITEVILIYFFKINANGYTDLQMQCSSQYDRLLLEMGEEKWKRQGRQVKQDPAYALVTSSLKIAGLYAGLRFLTDKLPPQIGEKACQFAVQKLTKNKKEGGGFSGALSGIKDLVDTFQEVKNQLNEGGDMMGLLGNLMGKITL
jgi:hypothetical protein